MFGLTPAETIGGLVIIYDWTVRILALFIVPRNRKPTSAMAWLLFIFVFPFIGLLVYLIIGSPKLPKSRRKAQHTLNLAIDRALRNLKRWRDGKRLMDVRPPSKYATQASLAKALTHLPVCGGNKIEIIHDYDSVIKRIAEDIDRAEHYVHLEYFIIALDDVTAPLFDALDRAVERGVVVRVLYDYISVRRYPDWRKTLKRLANDGVEAVAMLPLKFPSRGYVRPDLRNHRKIVIIDGQTAYTGSQNMIRRDYHRKDDLYYDELVARVQGPAAIELQAVFSTDWHVETGVLLNNRGRNNELLPIRSFGRSLAQILPSGPGYDDENNLKLFTSMIYKAEKRIVIVNPYFVPDDALTTAIVSAARRGVDITLINSEVMDQWMVGHAQRSYYEVFLRAGVKIYLYDAPILLHTKFMTIDNDLATIGSSNMDIRSFLLDLEVTMIVYDKPVVTRLQEIKNEYLLRATAINPDEWYKRPRRKVLLDNIARLTAALQ